jgi:hypothetical protein
MGWKLDAEALAYVDETIAHEVRDPVGSELMAPPESAPEEQPAAQAWQDRSCRARHGSLRPLHWQATPLIAKLVGTPAAPLPVKPASL